MTLEMESKADTVLQDDSYPKIWPTVRKYVETFDKASMAAVILCMVCMTLMVSLQVFWRYVLNSSIDSADEVSRLFFIWAIFLAIPHGIKYTVHVGIDILVMALNPRNKKFLFRVVSAASAILMAAVFYAAWVATLDKWQELMPTLPISAGIYYIAILICAAHSFIHLVLHAWLGPHIWIGRLP